MTRLFAFLSVAILLATPVRAASNAADSLDVWFQPIAGHPQAQEQAFLVARCYSFWLAASIRRQILRSNPVTGKNQEAGSELDWIDDRALYENLAAAAKGYDAADSSHYVGDYTQAFGPVTFPSKVHQLGLYKADKVACLDRFG
ncbi:MAG: hypothetical protein AB3N15_17740 [Paracoccaceae bacterium]